MKNRARTVSGLAALAAFLLAPLAEASLTRPTSPAIELPVLASSSTELEPSEFSLFEGNELAAAAAESGRAQSFHPLAAVSLFSKDGAEGPLVSLDEVSYPKTRVWGLRLFSQRVYLVERELSLEVRWGCASFSCGIASGTVGWLSQDPLGDQDSVNLYGFVGMRPHEKTDPLGLQSLGQDVGELNRSRNDTTAVLDQVGIAAGVAADMLDLATDLGPGIGQVKLGLSVLHEWNLGNRRPAYLVSGTVAGGTAGSR